MEMIMSNLEYVARWVFLVLVTALIFAGLYSCAQASQPCWDNPHSATDKYTPRDPVHEGKLCWHPSTGHTKITHQRASIAGLEPSYKQSSDAAYKLLTKPQLRTEVMRSINDFLLMHKLQYDPMLKDYLIRQMIERQERNIDP